jgi:hypothetical protein
MFLRMLFAGLALLLLPACAQTQDAATPASAPVPASASVPAPAASSQPYTEDTPVEKIAADPAAKAILNQDIPGMLDDIRYPMFKSMSLKQMSKASDGDLSQETVDKTITDLQALFPH